MNKVSTLRIDAPLLPRSRIHAGLYASLGVIMLLLAWLAELSWLQYGALMIISEAVAFYVWLSKPVLCHLSQPPFSKRVTEDWQLLMQTARGEALWQAVLCRVDAGAWYVRLEFALIEPYQRPLSVTVFRDQLNADDWQKLCVLANVIGPQQA